MRPDLEVVVPALNEERRIGATLDALVDELARLPMRCAVRVVDNGSSDRTAETVDRIAATGAPVTLIGCARRGKGAAVARGVLASEARWVGFCDADLATPASAITGAVQLLRGGADVVVGSRRVAGADLAVRQPVLRRIGGAGFRWLTRDLAGSITDTQCGFKFFDGDVARHLFSACTVQGFAFDLEVVARTHRSGLRIVEMPVTWEDRAGSTFSVVRDGRRVWTEVHRLRRSLAQSELVDVGRAVHAGGPTQLDGVVRVDGVAGPDTPAGPDIPAGPDTPAGLETPAPHAGRIRRHGAAA